MSEPEAEAYKPQTSYGQALADPNHMDAVEIYCDEPADIQRTIVGIELALALRFSAEIDADGFPRLAFTHETWEFIHRLYRSKTQTEPRELYTQVDLAEDSAQAAYTVPLAGFGQGRQAVEGRYIYACKPVKRRSTTFDVLGRKSMGSIKVVENKYYEAKVRTAKSDAPVRGITPVSYFQAGRLGTR
ncbi:MAG TPA: hypothetical protein VLE74_03810 [Candidatus Saccharimonadales bacterium]|nr:hypothetical protein [Candidatus Saccharimonadales bacterium]